MYFLQPTYTSRKSVSPLFIGLPIFTIFRTPLTIINLLKLFIKQVFMAEKEQQSPIPLAPARSDTEAASTPHGGAAEQSRKSKRIKCLLRIFLFAVFQTGIILLFAFTVMKIRTPKFRVESATLDNFNVAAPTNASLSLTMNAELRVKNSNFGRFKFHKTPVYFYYRGVEVAEVAAAKGRANWRSTEKFKVAVNVKVGNSAELERDLGEGVVWLSSRAKMRGDLRVGMMFDKKRAANMNCSMEIMTGAQQIKNIVCD